MRSVLSWSINAPEREGIPNAVVYDLCFNPIGSQIVAAVGNFVLVYDASDGLLQHRWVEGGVSFRSLEAPLPREKCTVDPHNARGVGSMQACRDLCAQCLDALALPPFAICTPSRDLPPPQVDESEACNSTLVRVNGHPDWSAPAFLLLLLLLAGSRATRTRSTV